MHQNQSTIQLDLLKYLNYARQHPTYYISLLQKQIDEFVQDGKQIMLSPNIYYETNQGKTAWQDAKQFLIKQKPLPPLQLHQGLTQSAKVHLQDLSKNQIIGHLGSDNSTFNERILRFCKKGPGAMSEMIGSDFSIQGRNTAQLTILSLIIDDGITDRGHRKTIFSDCYRYVGWWSGIQNQKIITVFNLTENNLSVRKKDQIQKSITSISNFATSQSIISAKNSPQPFKSSIKQVQTTFKQIKNSSTCQHPKKQPQEEIKYQHRSQTSSFWNSKNRNIIEKRENSRIYYEDNCKIIETTTKCFFEDGRVEQNTQKRYIYAPNSQTQ